MSHKIPCANPAHGVKNHIAGTAISQECLRESGPAKNARQAPSVPSAHSGSSVASPGESAEANSDALWIDLSPAALEKRIANKTLEVEAALKRRFESLGLCSELHDGLGPYISIMEGGTMTAEGEFMDFTAAIDTEPTAQDYGYWTVETNQGSGPRFASETVHVDSDPEKVADWVSDSLREWRTELGARSVADEDNSGNWDDNGGDPIVTRQFQQNFRDGISSAGLDCDAPDGSGATYIYLSTGHTLATGMEQFESAQLYDADSEPVDDLHFPEMKNVQTAEAAVRHWASFAVEAEKSLREGTYQKQE